MEVKIELDETMYSYVKAAADGFGMTPEKLVCELFLDGFKALTQELADRETEAAAEIH